MIVLSPWILLRTRRAFSQVANMLELLMEDVFFAESNFGFLG